MEQNDRDVEVISSLWPRVRHGKKSPAAVVAKRMKGVDVYSELQQEVRDSYRSGACPSEKTSSRPDHEESYEKETKRETDTGLQTLAWILAVTSFLYLMWHAWRLVRIPSLMQTGNKQLSEDLMHLNALSSGNGSFWEGMMQKQRPQMSEEWHGRIPKIIHQTYKTEDIPEELQVYVQSWKRLNSGWKYVFYNDTDCLDFIEREFPQYLTAYRSLPKNVERSDFFRYLVILRYGGIYADLDTECMVPIDRVLQPGDSLLVGWECDMESAMAAVKRHFVRKRQVLQWVFAAEPGHPVLKEICEFIGENAENKLSNVSSNHNTLEKTGPGIWTDTVLRFINTPASHHTIRVLPQVAFGVHPRGTDGLNPKTPGILVQHHFWGSWKSGGWGPSPKLLSAPFNPSTLQASVMKPDEMEFFPVSTNFTPSFMIMVTARGKGQTVGSSDVGSELTLHGMWQAGGQPPYKVRVVDVVAGSLGAANSDLHLLDIGAGLGFFSLAAASRRHPVIAFESNPSNLRPFKHSIDFNEFQERVQLYSSVVSVKTVLNQHSNCSMQRQEQTDLKLNRALKNNELWSDKSTAAAAAADEECHIEIGVIRIGNSGWSAWKALNGSHHLQVFEPDIVVVEFSPWTIKQAGWENPLAFLNEMVEMGYGEMYHAGELCEKRWQVLSKHSHVDGATTKPEWCNLSSVDFEIFHQIESNDSALPENILFVKRKSTAEAVTVL